MSRGQDIWSDKGRGDFETEIVYKATTKSGDVCCFGNKVLASAWAGRGTVEPISVKTKTFEIAYPSEKMVQSIRLVADNSADEIESLRQQLSDAQRTAEYWKAEHLAGNEQLAAARSENERLAESCRDFAAQAETDAGIIKSDGKEIHFLRQQLVSLKNELKAINKAIDDPRTDLTMTMSEIIIDKNQQLTAALAAIKSKDAALQSAISAHKYESGDLHDALAIQPDDSALKAWLGEPYAYAIVMPDRADIELVHDMEDASELLTNNRCEVIDLYALKGMTK